MSSRLNPWAIIKVSAMPRGTSARRRSARPLIACHEIDRGQPYFVVDIGEVVLARLPKLLAFSGVQRNPACWCVGRTACVIARFKRAIRYPVTLRRSGSSVFADDDTTECVVRACFDFIEIRYSSSDSSLCATEDDDGPCGA